MTLKNKIDAAKLVVDAWNKIPDGYHSPNVITKWLNEELRVAISDLRSALPDAPMTKSQALELVKSVWKEMALEAIKRGTILTADEEAYICIEALNKANCLYVKED